MSNWGLSSKKLENFRLDPSGTAKTVGILTEFDRLVGNQEIKEFKVKTANTASNL
jgi:hypothetical protein